MYYKRIIDSVVSEKVNEMKVQSQLKSNQSRIIKAKYSMEDIYVGHLAKRVLKNNGANANCDYGQTINPTPVLLIRKSLDTFKDIETDKCYEIVYCGKKSTKDDYYLPERFMEKFTVMCAETIHDKGIKNDTTFTVSELRQIMNEQEFLKQTMFY
ncbi:MAG: hypothetical protein IJ458_03170 [Clostridia bacterium]|nr:hypothetical protein [Clostridia bacterium]